MNNNPSRILLLKVMLVNHITLSTLLNKQVMKM